MSDRAERRPCGCPARYRICEHDAMAYVRRGCGRRGTSGPIGAEPWGDERTPAMPEREQDTGGDA